MKLNSLYAFVQHDSNMIYVKSISVISIYIQTVNSLKTNRANRELIDFLMISLFQKASVFPSHQEQLGSSSFGSCTRRLATSCVRIFHLWAHWWVVSADVRLQAVRCCPGYVWFAGSYDESCAQYTAAIISQFLCWTKAINAHNKADEKQLAHSSTTSKRT